MSLILLLASAASLPPHDAIIVTASREPVPALEAPVSATLFEAETLRALSLPDAADVLRLAPGVSVSMAGPRGSQTQLRIRGAEANHTLLFVDGIRLNDPAAGNEARFELLGTDLFSRLEIVRGPQSALWGSEALGGVIAADTADPFRDRGLRALGEYGSLDTSRLAAAWSGRTGDIGLTGSAAWLRSDGIDAFGAGGERDGFDQRAASAKAVFRPLHAFELGVAGHWFEGTSEFDGFDPVTFRRADTLDETENRIAAVRGWGAGEWGGWSLLLDGSFLDSENRNRIGDQPLNSTFGRRFTAGGQLTRRIGGHSLTAAIEREGEEFRARDQAFFGGTNQDRSRHLTAFVGQWRTQWSEGLTTDVAVRHDDFSAFADATTVRAAVLFRPAPQWTLHASYGEGIAQPTFYDLFGFFPGFFVGNPDLRPERSRGWEAGAAWRGERARGGVTFFSARLRDEIVDTFDPTTFLSSTANAEGKSRRRGIEAEVGYRLGPALEVSANYTLLDAEERQAAGAALVREVRRPSHSANLILHGQSGRLRYGTALSYVGERRDIDFEQFPAADVTLDEYLLSSLRVGWELVPGVEAYGRIENGFDADYQDVFGYATPGRTVHAGLRVALGR